MRPIDIKLNIEVRNRTIRIHKPAFEVRDDETLAEVIGRVMRPTYTPSEYKFTVIEEESGEGLSLTAPMRDVLAETPAIIIHAAHKTNAKKQIHDDGRKLLKSIPHGRTIELGGLEFVVLKDTGNTAQLIGSGLDNIPCAHLEKGTLIWFDGNLKVTEKGAVRRADRSAQKARAAKGMND